MRVIAGKFKGRRFTPPKNMNVRPTTDRAREALFGLVEGMKEIEGAEVLDLFAGTGAISVEFISRGAEAVVSIDVSSATKKFIEHTCEIFDISNLRMVKADVFKVLKKQAQQSFDIVFVDPPYADPRFKKIPDMVIEGGYLKPGGLLILEHPSVHSFENHPKFTRHKNYGTINFSFFSPE